MAAKSAGYSRTPLAKKLGIKEVTRLLPLHAPKGYRDLLSPLPDGVTFVAAPSRTVDLCHVFATTRASLLTDLKALRNALKPDAAVWVSWPKQASKIKSEIGEATIRELALPLGFVDIKVCAVNETWSGLKLVVRKELR
jgi:hypothetical protein